LNSAYRATINVSKSNRVLGFGPGDGKYNSDPEDKLRYDMIYIKNYSLLLDFKIILMTLGAMLPTSKFSEEKSGSDYAVGLERHEGPTQAGKAD
jgi:hypothetical protein